jgi:hypothetical protein
MNEKTGFMDIVSAARAGCLFGCDHSNVPGESLHEKASGLYHGVAGAGVATHEFALPRLVDRIRGSDFAWLPVTSSFAANFGVVILSASEGSLNISGSQRAEMVRDVSLRST